MKFVKVELSYSDFLIYLKLYPTEFPYELK